VRRFRLLDTLQEVRPDLAREWHPTKNGSLTPNNVQWRSIKRVWWKCGAGHEWQATLTWRVKSSGCPLCRNSLKKSLLASNPAIAQEWHPIKNGTLTPDQVWSNQREKTWWRCKHGHEWEAQIVARNRGAGCPYCKKRKISKETCLETLYPKLAKENVFYYRQHNELSE
jgi:lipopolysaccharide biosynthesis glycosyltransferase